MTRLTHQRRSANPRLGGTALLAVAAALALPAAPPPLWAADTPGHAYGSAPTVETTSAAYAASSWDSASATGITAARAPATSDVDAKPAPAALDPASTPEAPSPQDTTSAHGRLSRPVPTQAAQGPGGAQSGQSLNPARAARIPGPTQAGQSPSPTQAAQSPDRAQAAQSPSPTQSGHSPDPTQTGQSPSPTQAGQAEQQASRDSTTGPLPQPAAAPAADAAIRPEGATRGAAMPQPGPVRPAGGTSAALPPLLPIKADSVRDEQWQLTELQAKTAWRYSTGAGVIVAVIDSGVDASHEDLVGQVLDGKDLVKPGGGDGHTDPVGHGTTVAGLIAGRSDDDKGVMGLAPNAKILPIRVLDAENRYDDAIVVANAVRWAVDRGARVINLSLGGAGTSPALAAALDYAFARDVVVIACTGNVLPQSTTEVWYPAREPGVIAVAGLEKETDVIWNGSITGSATVLTAPATDLVGAKTGGFWRVRGTSFAAPLVSASAALVRARWPTMSAGDVVNRLIRTADDLGAPGRDNTYGFGRVDPVAALTSPLTPVIRNPLDDAKSPGIAGFGPAPGRLPDAVTGGGAHEEAGGEAESALAGAAAQRAASPAHDEQPLGWHIATAIALFVLAGGVVGVLVFARRPTLGSGARPGRWQRQTPVHLRRRQ